MTDLDPQVFKWEYRAGRRGPRRHDSLVALLPQPCGRVLDAGCGGGRVAMRLAAHAQWVTGLDLSQGMLALARRRYAATDLHNIAWLRGNVYGLPFPSSAFDCVVSTSVLHLVDLDRTLPELKRVAKSGGRLVLQDMVPPRAGPRFPIIHYLWFTLRLAADALATRGPQAACQITAERLKGLSSRKTAPFRGLTPESVRDAFSRHLPGWQLVEGHGMLIVWENSSSEAE